jgi:hypothetical protein
MASILYVTLNLVFYHLSLFHITLFMYLSRRTTCFGHIRPSAGSREKVTSGKYTRFKVFNTSGCHSMEMYVMYQILV